MKGFNSKDYDPEEEVQDVYGPPPFDEEPTELPEMQMVYGPPSYFSGEDKPAGIGAFFPMKLERGVYDKLVTGYNAIREIIGDFVPKIALVLGSGLGQFADESVDIYKTVDYSSLPDFPASTVVGHKGRFVFGYVWNTPVVVMQGRVHYYEGYTMQDVVMPTRLMSMLGAKALFLTNAAGGINTDFSAGEFMLIKDHISNFVPNPLIGKNVDELGVRFPDMSEIYNKKLSGIIRDTAADLNMKLHEGVYVQLTGPSYESPAEIRMLRSLGADAVGMSTAVEAIAARHAGMKVCAVSFISNLACGITDQPLSHAEVQERADKAAPQFRLLVYESIARIAKVI